MHFEPDEVEVPVLGPNLFFRANRTTIEIRKWHEWDEYWTAVSPRYPESYQHKTRTRTRTFWEKLFSFNWRAEVTEYNYRGSSKVAEWTAMDLNGSEEVTASNVQALLDSAAWKWEQNIENQKARINYEPTANQNVAAGNI